MVATRLVAFVLVSLVVSACGTPAGQIPPVYESTGAAERDTEQQDVPLTPNGTDAPDTDSATLALLNQSERARNSGNHVEAVAYVERAIRLNPRQADLWLRLARLHLAEQELEAAIQYANKTIALAGNRMDWVKQAWLVIADAREGQGDHAAAREIRGKWQTYRG